VVEPAELTISRSYEVSWKKQTLDLAELARLRTEEKLGSRLIAARLNAPRSTVIDAIRRLETSGNGVSTQLENGSYGRKG
jgi:biotin operon repressor